MNYFPLTRVYMSLSARCGLTMLGHAVGGQQQAGHLEATLSEDHLLGGNGEAAPVQAGHLHAGDGAGI